jgi:hypothetical protein
VFGIRIGRIFRSVFRAALGIGMGFLTGGPLGAAMAAFKEVLPKVLDKLPFAKFLKPALNFMSGGGPLSFLGKGPMGLIGGLMDKIKLPQMPSFLRALVGNAGGLSNLSPDAIHNLAHTSALFQSRKMF